MPRRREPVLLLHGQPGSAGDWDGVVGALPGRMEPIAIDRPGWDGHSRAAGLAGNAAAALSALDRAGVERATVVGHSFGGAVAAWLAAEQPQRVASLVLAAPSANRASLLPIDWMMAAPVAGFAVSAAALTTAGGTLATGPLRRRIAHGLALEDGYLQSAARRLVRPATWRSFVIEQRVLVRELPELERRLGSILAPTRIVAGSRDPVVPSRSLRRLAEQISHAELVVLPGAGHLLPLQQAGTLAEEIQKASRRA